MSVLKALVLLGGALSQVPPGDTVSDWSNIANKPATFPPSSHSHPISDVTGLQTALDGKAALIHIHAIADVTGLQTALDARELLTNKSNDSNLGSSTSLYPTQAAVKTYVDQSFAANDAMVFKGTINASANPNYPAADAGHTYRVSVAGKIGGGAGPNVEIGDMLICTVDATPAGTHAAVGANWSITQANIDGAVIGPAAGVTNLNPTVWDGASGRLVKEVTYSAFKLSLAIGIADVASLQTSLDAKLNVVNPVATGNLTLNAGTGAHSTFAINRDAGFVFDMSVNTAGARRWLWRFADPTAEGGADTGSNFSLSRYTDAGSSTQILVINRASGVANFTFTPLVGGSPLMLASAYTAADVLAKLVTVDGAGSGLDADLFDGQSSAFYQNAGNLNAGVVPDARITGAYTGITNLTMAGNLSNTGGYFFINRLGDAAAAMIYMDADAGMAAQFNLRGPASAPRWVFGKDSVAEAGANAGSDFFIYAYADNGAALGQALSIDRASRVVNFPVAPTMSGIKFPATQVPSADPGTLDDYEEGTFTPVVSAFTTAPTGVTYSIQDGGYTKVGRVVTITYMRCVLTSLGTGGVGIVRVTGLPFAANGAITSVSSIMRFSGATLTAGFYSCFWLIGSAAGSMQQSGNASAGSDVQWSQLASNFNFISNAVYHV